MMNKNKEHTLFVEKYRPVSLENYIGNEHLKTKVSKLHEKLKGHPF